MVSLSPYYVTPGHAFPQTPARVLLGSVYAGGTGLWKVPAHTQIRFAVSDFELIRGRHPKSLCSRRVASASTPWSPNRVAQNGPGGAPRVGLIRSGQRTDY